MTLRRTTGWLWPAKLALVSGILLFLAGAGYHGVTVEVPVTGGKYIEAVAGTPVTINPILAPFNDADQDLVALMFSGLTKLGKDGESLPDLAERWDIDQTGRIYTFNLRKDARWHDGSPVTSEDVVFTLGLLKLKNFPGVPEMAEAWKGIEAISLDASAVRLTLKEPFAPFLTYTTLGILPKHILGTVAPEDIPKAGYNASPVGTGPFQFERGQLGRVALKSNLAYYGGAPFLSQLDMLFVADEPTAVAAVKTGKAHGVLLPPDSREESIKTLSKDRGLNSYSGVKSSYTAVFLNTTSAFFTDSLVRKAMLMALDRKALLSRALGGRGAVAAGPVVPGTWAYSAVPDPAPYDPKSAALSLERAGWRINSSGIRERGGVALRFSIVTNDNPGRVSVGKDVVDQWRGIGIGVDLLVVGLSDLLQGYVIPRRFDAVLYGVDTGYDPDGFPMWHSSQIDEDGLNLASYSQPEMDRILREARRTTDISERKRLYSQFQRLFNQEVPSIILYHPGYTYWVNKNVKGVDPGVLFEPSSRFRNIKEWYIDTGRTLRHYRNGRPEVEAVGHNNADNGLWGARRLRWRYEGGDLECQP